MEQWDDEEAEAIISPNMFNGESKPEPLAARQDGIPGVRGTYDWLHAAYEDLHWEIHTIVAEGEWAVGRTTMSGRQTGPFTQHGPDGEVQHEFPATGRPFAVSQTHWYRIADGKLVEHHADRDDLGQAMQLGWFGPSQDESH
jgi:predicted ester cyclase